MNKRFFIAFLAVFWIFSNQALAQEPPADSLSVETQSSADAENAAEESPGEKPAKPRSSRSKMLFGQPVNVNIAGGGTLPKGKALTILNASFADKTNGERGYSGSDVFSQTWLAKFRYGITNHLELSVTVPYINNERSNPRPHPKHVEGFSDTAVGLVVAPFNLHQGDPVAWSIYTGLLAPTGTGGKNHLPGVGVWGWRLATGVAAYLTDNIKADTEVVWCGPFDRGNQKVRRGDQFQWNTQVRYLFDNFDIGIESTLVHQESGDRNTLAGNVNTRNGYTEWFVGPSLNVPIDALDMWAGVGVFFPVVQDYKGPAAVEDARFEFKIGRLW